MTQDPGSLDRLHDIVLPPDVPWWPLAPGWYAVLAIGIVFGAWLAWRRWQHWRSNAYRRAALHELAVLGDTPAIAELLRRTALAIAPRETVAAKTGAAWPDWLAEQCAEPMPDAVRAHLTRGVYGRPGAGDGLTSLRDYAARWIAGHRWPATAARRRA